jgi:hypothetical protein
MARRSTTGSIPLPSSHVHRTQSEVQLSLDQEAAERRDASMFYRLVNGIRERQNVISSHDSSTTSEHLESVRSITGILHTRLADLASEDALNDEDTESQQGVTTAEGIHEVSGVADGWSITGYMSSHPNHNLTAAAAAASTATMATDAVDKQVDDDDCIFDLDF